MGANSKIQWTTHTFNPWTGCTKVSAACDHCYAETWARRAGKPELWHGVRNRTTDSYWRQPFKWDREARAAGERRRVFCASLADVFDNQVPMQWRRDLFDDVIKRTPNLDWILLTKRPQNIRKMIEEVYSGFFPWPWPNVWLGTTVENQEEADRRIPHLLSVPATVHFLSCEPLLGPVRLRQTLNEDWLASGKSGERRGIDWVIVGGESGGGARPLRAEWVRSLVKQCRAAAVPVFMKQMGHKIIDRNDAGFGGDDDNSWDVDEGRIEHDIHGYLEEYQGADCLVTLGDKKGADMGEWPADLRVREMPLP